MDHFDTQLVTTLKYSAITDLHTLAITKAHATYSPAFVFISRSLVTASNSGDSSNALIKPFLHSLPYN